MRPTGYWLLATDYYGAVTSGWAAGVTVGLGIAAIASRGLTSLLFGVSRLDPVSYGAVVVVLISVAALASWLPAWRASRIDPSVTLRSE